MLKLKLPGLTALGDKKSFLPMMSLLPRTVRQLCSSELQRQAYLPKRSGKLALINDRCRQTGMLLDKSLFLQVCTMTCLQAQMQKSLWHVPTLT